MFLDKTNASARRIREAEHARRNRLEIVRAHSTGELSRRDMFKLGIFTSLGTLASVNGFSPFARSAFAAVPTGTPASPTFGAGKWEQPMSRAVVQTPMALTKPPAGMFTDTFMKKDDPLLWNGSTVEAPTKCYSWHEDFTASGGAAFKNPVTGVGPMEGRPHGDFFCHQRWEEIEAKKGYILSLGQVKANSKFHPKMAAQDANAVWSFGTRSPGQQGNANGLRTGSPVPQLMKIRYGEPLVTRIYNDLPVDRAANGGFGRNEISTHFHNAVNGAESDGACNAYHFPGTFYDYHWGVTMHRRDRPDLWNTADPKHLLKASGPDDGDGLVKVAGDYREIQGSMWFHDHRFFFTAENVHKGNFHLCNAYSGIDRGRDNLKDGINLCLPSGNQLPWGNTDFDVNLCVSNPAFDQQGQLFFDIFDTDGFLGDVLAVNGAYYPYMEVLPRRYRFRLLNASMARFIKLAISVNQSSRYAPGTRVPFHFIANDGNLVVSPLQLLELDEQGVGERYDIIVDFSAFRPGDSIYLVNMLKQTNGRMPDGPVTMAQALAGVAADPCVGPILKFKVVSTLKSVDNPNKTYDWTKDADPSINFANTAWTVPNSTQRTLTAQIPIVAPVRERTLEWVRSAGDSRNTPDGQCVPDCGTAEAFPWSVRVNGQGAHSANANRISITIPKPGEVEHWTIKNGGAGWDHPIHLHFEEGVTMDRGTAPIPATEKLVRKDVWRLRPGGQVKFQVRFGEFGGSYVSHCHNTIHEDFAMLLRYQLMTPPPGDQAWKGQKQYMNTDTPMPTPSGVKWMTPEILPEGDPKNTQFFTKA
jgi:FtsP/CotA-like multicopper oxidase with cupredoxin domain